MKHFVTLILIALLGLTVSPTAPAQGHDRDRRGDRGDRGRSEGMSLDEAVAMVERRFKAKVVRTEVRQDGDRKIYVLRLLNDESRVWTVRVDASSGSVQ
jgi:uncharacterized membrane protein YkoI